MYIHTHTHTHTQTCKHRQTASSHCSSFVYTRNTSHMFCTRLANGGLFPTGDPIVPFVISPRFECLNKRTHTQTCKHRQTGSSHCSSFVYTRNTSHMFCTRLANGGLFPTGDPIVPFVISPRFECLNKLTHTYRATGGMVDLHV